MKRKKRTQRLLAMLLTLMLCMGEFASTGFSVLAEDEKIADTVSDTDAVSEDESSVPAENVSENEAEEPEDETGEEAVSEDTVNEHDADTEEETEESVDEDDEGDSASVEDEEQSYDTEEGDNIEIPDVDVEEDELQQEDFEKNALNTMLGTSGIADPRVPASNNDKWQGSYVYYGKLYDESVKVLYRILDKKATQYSSEYTILLESDDNLYRTAFVNNGTHNDWRYSDLREHLNGRFYKSSFTAKEQMAIQKSNKEHADEYDGTQSEYGFAKLTGDYIFVLDVAEATRPSYGFSSGKHNESKFKEAEEGYNSSWLRTSGYTDTSLGNYKYNNNAAFVNGWGLVSEYGASVLDGHYKARPAFNISSSSVLTASAIVGAKGDLNTVYKFTLADSNMIVGITNGKKVMISNSTVEIPYQVTGNNANDAEAVSVLILDKEYTQLNSNEANILYYGKLDTGNVFAKNGAGTFTLPSSLDISKWGSSYHVYLLAEDINGAYETDYASLPTEIKSSQINKTVSYIVTFDNNGHGTAPASQTIAKGRRAKKPEDLTEDGWTFKGWYTSNTDFSDTYKYDFSQPVNSGLTLYAYWLKKHVVTFNTNGHGTAPESQYITDGESAKRPSPDPQASNYQFQGWYVNEACTGSPYIFSTPVTADTVLYASWKNVTNYKVTFDMNGESGTAPAPCYVTNGQKLSKPDDPVSEEGWVFDGWYKASSCKPGEEYDFYHDTVTEAITLYAKWADELNLWINGEQVTRTNFYMNSDWLYKPAVHELELKNESFDTTYNHRGVGESLPGMEFEAYIYAKDMDIKVTGSGKMSDSATPAKPIQTAGIYVDNGTLTLDADIEFKDLGAGFVAKDIVIDGGNISFSSNLDPEFDAIMGFRNPYGIMAYYSPYYESSIRMNGGNVCVETSGSDAVAFSAYAGDIKIYGGYLYAKADGSKNGKAIYAQVGDGTIYNSLLVIKPAGGKLDVSEKYFTDAYGDEVYEVELAEKESLMRTVTFDLNGKPGTAPEAQILMSGKKAVAPVMTKVDGYDFNGWYTSAACKDDEKFSFDTPITENITLYAKWTQKEYSVLFDLNGKGEAYYEIQNVKHGEKAKKPAVDPEAEGYVFKTWCTDAEGTTPYNFETPVTESFNLYAKWEDKDNPVTTYTVDFVMNGHGIQVPSQLVDENGKVTEPDAPIEEGWTFGGWYTDEALTAKYVFDTPVTKSFKLYAKWSQNAVIPGHSPLDPRPEIKEDTTDLWLVKGQKFIIGNDWKVADDKVSKKYVSISKKGQLKAKKADGGAEVKIKNSVTNKELTLHISKPEIDKKLTLTIVSANTASSNQIKLTKDEHLDVLYYSAAPDVAVVAQDGTVTAVAKGKAKITAYINGSAYICTVNVKETVTPLERTIHVTKGASKPILKIQGVKKVDWKSASDNVAKVEKNKVKAGKDAGNTVLTASANGLEYKINVFVEDPAVSMTETAGVAFETKSATKYEIMIPKGKEVTLSFASMDQPVVFKSTKPDIAFVDENGNVEARSKGKGKFTAKINGKTITITVKVTE